MTSRTFRKELASQIKNVTPGLKLIVLKKGKVICEEQVGKTYPYYDWASLTKAVFTTSAMMKLFEKKADILNQTVHYHCPWFKNKSVKIHELMNHSSGLFWWRPFYKSIDTSLTLNERRIQIFDLIRNEKPASKLKSVYSDVNYLLLASLLERCYDRDLHEIWLDLNNDLELEKTRFHINNKPQFEKSKYAPTEYSEWRKKRMQGEVHDENTWALGGIATHAGLFGPIEDLAGWGQKLSRIYNGRSGFVKTKTLKTFFKRSVPVQKGNWATGFMTPSAEGSSAGDYLSRKSVGYLGFTGTSFWYDMTRDMQICLFTNRVYYGRKNPGILDLRRFVHNRIGEMFCS